MQLTLVKPATQPEGEHPYSSLCLGSYSGASAVTVVKVPASTEAAAANEDRPPARAAVRAKVLIPDVSGHGVG